MLNDSRTTVERRSTDGQSQRHYKQTPLSKRWKVLMTLVFLFTLGIGQMWGADVIEERTATNDAAGMKNAGTYLKAVTLGDSNASWSSNKLKISSNKTSSFTVEINSTYSSTYTIKSLEFEWDGSGRPSSFSGNSIAVSGNTTWSAGTTTPTKVDFAITTGGSEIKIKKITATLTPKGSSCTAPTITTDLSTTKVEYEQNAAATPLAIEATGTNVTYQWYSNTENSATTPTPTALENCTTKTYTPSTSTSGTTYYFCIASSSTCSTTSKITPVEVKEASGGGDPEPRNLFTINMTATSETSITHGTKVELTSTYGTVTGGYTVLYNKHSSDDSKLKVNSNGISISGNDPCVILYLNEPLHVGDKIEFTSSSSNQIKIGVVDNKDQTLVTTSSKSYTVASEGLAGKQVIYLWRVSSTTYIKTLTISTTAELPTFRTVTFNPNYTSATNITRTVADGAKVVYVPADPENGTNVFEGWFEGSAENAFDFANTAITANKTLTAHWTAPAAKYSVTYAAGEGSGTMTDANEYEENDEVTVLENAFTTPAANKKFSGWSSSPSVTISNGKFSMPASNVTLTAQWTEFFTITYKDGESTLKTEDVFKNATPVGYTPTKALNTFAGWKDGDGNTVDPTTLTAAATLFAQWTKTYANSVDFETYIAEHDGDKNNEDKAKTYVESQNYALSTKTGTTFDATTDNNGAYKGLKIKHSGTTLSWNVAAGKLVIFKTGFMDTNGSLSINGGAATAIDGGSKSSGDNFKNKYFYSAVEALYVFTTGNANAAVVKAITIQNPFTVTFDANGGDDVASLNGTPSITLPSATKGTEVFKGWYDAATEGNKIGNAGDSYTPTANVTLHAQWEAVSSDNTLNALEVDGVALADFDPDKHIYNIVCEYGHTPKITLATATAAAQGATVAINNTPVHYQDADNDFWYVQANVTPASGTPIGYNQVRYTNLPKQGATIFKAELTAANDADYSGLYADEANSEIKLIEDNQNNDEYKFSGTGNYIKIALQNGTFAADDVLKMTYSTNPQNGYLALYPSLDSPDSIVSAASPATTLVLPAGAEAYNTLYIRRTNKNNYNAWVTAVEVQRLMDPFINSFKIGEVAGTINESAKTIAIELPNGTSLSGVAATVEAYANGGATVTAPAALAYNTPLEYTVSSAYAEDGNVVYTVTITEAEASHDATLSDIKLNGVSLTGFNSATLSYDVELAKGTSAYPTVTYVAATGATVEPNNETFPGAYNLVVTAQDGTTTQTYTIHFTVSTSDIITIFDGSTMSDMATSPSGAISWEKVGSTMSAGDKNATYNNVTYTRSLSCGNSSTTKHFKIVIADNNTAKIEVVGMSNSSDDTRHAWLTNSTEKGEYAAAIAGLETAGYNCADFTTDWLEEGAYYLHSDNTVNIFLIRVTSKAVPAKCEQPVISGLADVQVCDIASAELNGTATVADGGTVSYKWYAEGGTDVLATTATYTPTAVGNYYVVATNTLADHRDNSTTSEVVSVSLYEATSVTMSDISGKAAASIALNAVAEGPNPHYAWFTCDDAEGNNAVAIAGAADAASYAIPTPVATQYYKVVVTTDCGSVSAVALVTLLPDVIEQTDVTGTTEWNLVGIVSAETAVDATALLANVDGVTLAYSDKLNVAAGKIRTGYYQGYGLNFHATVPGMLTVEFSNTGSSDRPYRELIVNGTPTGVKSKTSASHETCKVAVKPGDVELTVIIYDNDGHPTTTASTLNFYYVKFDADFSNYALTDNALNGYTREITAAGQYGTICLPNGGVMVGAAIFEVAYMTYQNNTPYKVFFDEILNGEMVAGRPYIFMPNEDAEKIAVFYTDNANADAGEYRGLHGTYTQMDGAALQGKYIFYNNTIFMSENSANWLNANRAYIVLSEVQDYETPASAGRRRVSMGVNAPAIATGLEDVQGNHVQCTKVLIDGQLYILRGEKMYDAKGQLVK